MDAAGPRGARSPTHISAAPTQPNLLGLVGVPTKAAQAGPCARLRVLVTKPPFDIDEAAVPVETQYQNPAKNQLRLYNAERSSKKPRSNVLSRESK